MTLGVIAFVVALLVSIMLHEAGHFATAKAFGMKATRFFLGFGPTVWSFRRGETEYGIKAVPAGGFVKIVGMTPLEDDEPGDDEPGDSDRAFHRQPAPQRAIVLAAGSTMHFIIGFLLIWVVLSGVGLPALSTTIATVSPCVTVSDPGPRACQGEPTSPAAEAGLHAGDRIVAFAGQPVEDWTEDLAMRVRDQTAGPVPITVVRDGARITRTVDLEVAPRPGVDHPIPVLGVTSAETSERVPIFEGFGQTVDAMGQYFVLSGKALGAVPAAIPDLFQATVNDTERDGTGLVGPVGAARAGGQAIAAGSIGAFLVLIAGLNIFVGLFNLLPLLPLDGGHLAILGFEKAREGVYRLLGRPHPGHVDMVKLLPAAYLVVMVFVGLSVLLLFADVVNPIENPFR